MAWSARVPRTGRGDGDAAGEAPAARFPAAPPALASAPPSGATDSAARALRRSRASGRPPLWRELLLVAVCYLAYEMVRNLVPADPATAAHRAYELLGVEDALHADVEYDLNRTFVAHAWLAIGANYFYATMHFIATIGILLYLYIRRPERYGEYRTLLFATTVLGLAGFWAFPLAPPRMLPGFTDTVTAFGTWGIYGSGPGASVSNQYAAMPSIHTAWSLWCAMVVIGVARRRLVKAVALLYPAATIVVIMGTANHFLLDAAGGAVTLAAGLAVGRGAFLVKARARAPGQPPAP
ncbi:phosphatase PAP2 family protein [Actinomadura roseirufa]|uniref:phosphatase PAP2 family protein n=1 Tax=Actinomadura roseirufa TaxID=2094049 RepID=UPI001F5EE526|nr:phosphatase PAP2 family protein [Actinomadura roseirufa]